MDKSSLANFHENVAPSAPASNGSEQDDYMVHSLDGNQPPPQQAINTRFMPHQPDKNDSYCGRLSKNRTQATSVAGGLLLMINSGLHIGWGLWRSSFYGPWTSSISLNLFMFILMAWSVGAFVGGFAASILTPMLRKNSIYYASAAVMIVGNLLFVIWDAHGESLATGRVLMGFAHGIAYVTLITHAGENAAKNMRATILSIVNCMLFTGIFVSVAITGATQLNWWRYPETISADRIVGIVGNLLAVSSIGFTIMMTVETVPFLLNQNNQPNAMMNFKRLRGSTHETLALTEEMEEFHLNLVQDKQDNWNIFTDGNRRPLVLMILMRLMVALTNNLLINIVAVAFASGIFESYSVHNTLVPLICVAPRLGMSILQIFYADIFKRKVQLIVSSTLASITLIVAGIISNTIPMVSYDELRPYRIAFAFLVLLIQFACSIGMDQMQDVYLSEAFSTAKKRWSLPLIVAIEHIFHIFMIGMYFFNFSYNIYFNINAIVFASAVVFLLLGILLVYTLPETRNMTLKQAKDSFLNSRVSLTSPFA